ncbi:MAG: family transcriptional regulator, cyclic receptor protein [Candidatus Hydrogenedentes bacterium]|nr:family transcriptional regulator, cyclic receptor protein [Candidatus Hydrogenedentota bacterium]
MKQSMRLALSLREEPFFRTMSESLLTRIENYVFHREYETRQIVYFPDDACDFVYWVREGRVKVTRVSGDGRELTFRHLAAGDILGEECLVERPRRGAYAEAMEPTVLCLMRADDFRRIAREECEVSLKVAQRLCQRTVEIEQVLSETVFKTVRCRVASGLLRAYRRNAKTDGPALRLTHQEIASLIGSTRETTTAVLHGFREEGVLSLANRRLIVLDPVALEHAAGGR